MPRQQSRTGAADPREAIVAPDIAGFMVEEQNGLDLAGTEQRDREGLDLAGVVCGDDEVVWRGAPDPHLVDGLAEQVVLLAQVQGAAGGDLRWQEIAAAQVAG